MTELDLDLLIENWIRWSRTRQRLPSIASLEGNWRSPQPWDKPPTALPPIDKLAGQMVEDAWATMPSHKLKLLLKWHYIYRRTVGGIIKALRAHGYRLAPTDYDIALIGARAMLKALLDKGNLKEHHAPTIREPGRADRPLALRGGERFPERI